MTVGMLLAPLLDGFVWGFHKLHDAGAFLWFPYGPLALLALWFLLRRSTLQTMQWSFTWRSRWMVANTVWLLLLLLVPIGIAGLKFQLAREHGTKFWATTGPLQTLNFAPEYSADHEDWIQVEVLGISFPIASDFSLGRFSVDRDELSLVSLHRGSDEDDRQVVIIFASDTLQWIPLSVREQAGAKDPMDFARVTMSSNWGLWSLVYSHFVLAKSGKAFWLEDETRKILALPRSSDTGSFLNFSLQGDTASNVTALTYTFRTAIDTPQIAAIATRLHSSQSSPHAPATTNGIAHQLILLETFWDGDINAGIELAKLLLTSDAPAVSIIAPLLDRIEAEAPAHPDLEPLKEHLNELRE